MLLSSVNNSRPLCFLLLKGNIGFSGGGIAFSVARSGKEYECRDPTYYPTYSPTTYSPTTTLQKGSHKQRDKSKQQNKERMPPTESPTIQKIQFLEDVSASKTLAMVIGLMLTL